MQSGMTPRNTIMLGIHWITEWCMLYYGHHCNQGEVHCIEVIKHSSKAAGRECRKTNWMVCDNSCLCIWQNSSTFSLFFFQRDKEEQLPDEGFSVMKSQQGGESPTTITSSAILSSLVSDLYNDIVGLPQLQANFDLNRPVLVRQASVRSQESDTSSNHSLQLADTESHSPSVVSRSSPGILTQSTLSPVTEWNERAATPPQLEGSASLHINEISKGSYL